MRHHVKGKILIASLALAILAGGGAMYAQAQTNDNNNGYNWEKWAERNEAMRTAFENNDYNAWKNLVGDRAITKRINEQNFARYAEMHRLMWEGKFKEAGEIRKELNLGWGEGNAGGRRNGNGRGCGCSENGGFIDENNDGVCDRIQ